MKKDMTWITSWTSWPALMILCCSLMAYGMSIGYPVTFFNIAYFSLAAILLILERLMPHERQWNEPDGQNFANIAHTLTSKGTVQTLLIFGGIIGLSALLEPPDNSAFWPHDWPIFFQITLALVAAEFGLYWAHRLAHEVPLIWRFHAIHHSVKRLWIINTGRFHFIDSLFSIILGSIILLILGAPMEMIQWLSAITAFIGMLTHCNVEMRFGPISWVFNTPGLHRWHHSMDLREGNKNYGENLMIWDQIFGTYFNEHWRRPPVTIGIHDYMPPKFVDQLLWPFYSKDRKKQIEHAQTF